ncbi:flagellar biosynthesis regulator FlhF [Bacillus manliponensis]|uniref:Flagellar biosynthesis protein FlhF n=1 Tax=Bacillus manliponensis TaxID=574376 RepID=A0A073K276_9BACI|nr:AAA family ATPase [Bacillus manliponensis]KEK20666.1 flagellar biosynthesis regulator FlhF [Bacillus manliponensis]
METAVKREQMKKIEASSKSELYRKLFEQHGNDYYVVVDETVKRRIPFFWKKKYEMLVSFPEGDVAAKSNENFHEKLMGTVQEKVKETTSQNSVQLVLHNLANKTSAISDEVKSIRNSEEIRKKKEELLQLFEQGFVTLKNSEDERVKPLLQIARENFSENVRQTEVKHTESVPFIIEKMIRTLQQNEVEEHFLQVYRNKLTEKFQHAAMITEEEVISFILEEMGNYFRTENVFEKDVQTIALVGPTGVGKTTTLAKIAWQLHQHKKTVGFITTDHSRVGTVQQLQQYVSKIGVEVLAVKDKAGIERALSYFKEEQTVDYILIDTAGKNYRTKESIEMMIEEVQQIQPDYMCLTLSASMKSKDMIEIITNFKDTGIDGFIFTKFDETASSGELLKIPAISSAPIIFTTDGQDMKKNIQFATAQHLAKQMLQTS